jgi:DNA-binding GntR family transcriptional regulator
MAQPAVRTSTRKQRDAITPEKTAPEEMCSSKVSKANQNASVAAPGECVAGAVQSSPKLKQIVYDKLLRAIVQGRLDLGEPLSENDLARALNLSKAPIRESLGELRVRGLVEVVQRSGTYVFSPTADQIAQLCDYRALLETNALVISSRREPKALVETLRHIVTRMKEAQLHQDLFANNELDKQFHMTLIRLSGNRYLTESYEHIGLTVEALRYRVMSTSLYHSKVQEEHARLVELIAGGQIAKAARLLEQHIQRVRRVQSEAEWGGGRLKRKDYRFRNYAEILI